METSTTIEKQRALAIAEKYRDEGYEVIPEPASEHLPEFLRNYRPDLLVRKGDEAIIVEVKSRSSLANEPSVRELARLRDSEPNWRFELVLVAAEEQSNMPPGSRSLDKVEIRRSLDRAEKLLASKNPEASLLIAWAGAEATLRLLIEAAGATVERLNPLYVLKQAVMHGVITRRDYKKLSKILKYRNSLAHGFQPTDFEPSIVQDIVQMTKRLLE